MAREMTERVAISKEVKDRLTEFKEGVGLTYDETIELMLELIQQEGKSLRMSGVLIRTARDEKKVKRVSISE